MRNCLWLLVLLSACNSKTSSSPDNTAPAVAPATSTDVAVTTPHVAPDKKKVEVPPESKAPLTWMTLINETDTLKAKWASLPEGERAAYYAEWSSRTDAMTKKLIANMDGKELQKLQVEGKLKDSVRTVSAEGFFVGMYVSEAWLLKQFPSLPEQERAYLQWLIDSDENSWFAEGELQVEVSAIQKSYEAGIEVFKNNSDWFRGPSIKAKLDGTFGRVVSLLTQRPLGKDKKKFARDVKTLFQAVASSDLHQREAKAFIEKLPAKGIPYDYDVVDGVKESLGMLD